MSTRRVSKAAGWCVPSRLPRGEHGRALCRECLKEVPPGRRTFCSDGCVDAWKVKTDPGHVRRLVFRRDQGKCALCPAQSEDGWEADHIIPVVEGGGECGLDNYRTLCTPCHKRVTAELRGRMAERQRETKLAEARAVLAAPLQFGKREIAIKAAKTVRALNRISRDPVPCEPPGLLAGAQGGN